MHQQKQRGSIEGVIIICLVLALVTALGWIFWQNFMHKESETKNTDVVIVEKKEQKKEQELNQNIVYSPAVVVSSNDGLGKLAEAPAQFKAFINDKYLKSNAGYMAECKAGVTVERIYKQSYAIGGFGVVEGGCAGGARLLWAKDSSGAWTEVAATQNAGFDCAALKKYSVPSEIAGKECLKESVNGGEGSMVPYSQEQK